MIFVVDGMMCAVFVDAQLEVLSFLRLLSNPRSSRLLLKSHFSFHRFSLPQSSSPILVQ